MRGWPREKSSARYKKGGMGVKPVRSLRLVTLGAVLAAVLIAAPVSAETWTLLWSEDFCVNTGWNVAVGWVIETSVCDLGSAAGAWFGPTYRTSGTWNPSTQPILKIHLENIYSDRSEERRVGKEGRS